MNPIVIGTLKGKLLEIQQNSFKGNDGKDVEYSRLLLRTSNGIVQLKPQGDFNFEPYVDKEVTLDVAMTIFNMKATFVVTGVNGKAALPKP